ncbi:adenosylmethionine decarboxylase [Sandarakinorhabdus sp. DWP1-3-1]|uniref:adenosylmethionine decarboxylase n=1 Tax=Sandarakinorhabdus sp. DWP1-3-1 TaxID=2804627 RepID=UPI003CEB140F
MTALGTHLLADLYGCRHLDDPVAIEAALRAAVLAAGATLIDIRLHHFGGHHGVTGVALLAESHMSIHSWPEYGFAAIDIFLCGATQSPAAALATVAAHLAATRIVEHSIARGGHVGVDPAR